MAADDRGPELAATVIVFLALSAITLALRCYVRARILKVFKIEDWLAIATMICFACYCIFALLSISYGEGKRIVDVPVENIPKILKMRWAGELVYVVTSLFIKFTVGVFLLRICSQAWQKTVVATVLLVCLIYQLFFAFMAAFQCQPVPYYWYRYTGKMTGKCWSNEFITGATYAAAAINAVSDWVLGLLPIALVRDLRLSKRSKVLVSCILAIGSIASTATIVRIPYICKLTQTRDLIYDFTDLSIWSTVENGLGLVASSVATLRPLVRVMLGGSRAGTPSQQRRSFYSWRRSGTVAVHNRTRSENLQYYRMGDYHYNPYKAPERVRVRDRKTSSFG
ncbi:hypothetical protein F5Y06DRAFT_294613 [Hypoxylon sp. FL0890]|nr:hypothetical protein F5Y06DRAFT_294613 [Hypoxylon sp. FL0890]